MKKSINKEGEITNEQALQIIDKKLITEEKMLNLNKSYKNKFLAVLTPKEYLKLHKVEREFLHWLREKSDLKRKGNHNGEGAGPPQGVNH